MEVQEKLATRDVRNVRHTIGLARPPALQPGELTVSQVAARLGTKPGTVYYWLKADLLPHHKRATGAVCIPFDGHGDLQGSHQSDCPASSTADPPGSCVNDPRLIGSRGVQPGASGNLAFSLPDPGEIIPGVSLTMIPAV